jgi:hypothetical protein
MSSFLWLIIGLFVAWIVMVAVITTLLVKRGKLKLKKGGAPGASSSGGSDASLNL